MLVVVTGSSGLIGSAAARHWDVPGNQVIGIDNDMRSTFFGPTGSTEWNRTQLESETKYFRTESLDIRNRDAIFELFKNERPDLIIHCAAQPSHDRAAAIPFLDFEVNANGTLNLLEATRQFAPEAVFCHMSTNKVMVTLRTNSTCRNLKPAGTMQTSKIIMVSPKIAVSIRQCIHCLAHPKQQQIFWPKSTAATLD